MAKRREPLSKAGRFFARLDYLQLASMLALIGTGLVFIYSTGVQIGGDDPAFFFRRQLLWIACGSVLWLAGTLGNTRSVVFKVGIVVFCIAVLGALIAVLFAGVRVFGATRWLAVGGFRIQPSEFAKLALASGIALIFSLRGLGVNTFSGIAVSGTLALIYFFLIAREPDFGSAIVLLPIYAAVAFVAGLKWKKIIFVLCSLGIVSGIGVANELWGKPLLHDYQRKRILVFLDPERDRLESGYNAYQARLAVGSGGFSGKGIGEGTQNELGFLPRTVSNNDFILSVIAEETGFAGITALLLLFALLLYSIVRCAYFAPDDFGRYFGVGVAMIFFTHLFINIGMSFGVTPVTGLSLPFVSYGGSFLMTAMAALGILQSIHRTAREEN
ncbi:MAG: rod shape-determining protein RodA [Victivallaceae bacterium]|nr:rod shape-determining protein RodA [Victivallaceae bacterium]